MWTVLAGRLDAHVVRAGGGSASIEGGAVPVHAVVARRPRRARNGGESGRRASGRGPVRQIRQVLGVLSRLVPDGERLHEVAAFVLDPHGNVWVVGATSR